MKWAIALMAPLTLSCGIRDRPETPDYFEEVTGISLCSTARVRNVNLEQAERAGGGFVYEVDLVMDQGCADAFETAMSARIGGLPADESMSARRIEGINRRIRFTYIG